MEEDVLWSTGGSAAEQLFAPDAPLELGSTRDFRSCEIGLQQLGHDDVSAAWAQYVEQAKAVLAARWDEVLATAEDIAQVRLKLPLWKRFRDIVVDDWTIEGHRPWRQVFVSWFLPQPSLSFMLWIAIAVKLFFFLP